MNSHLQAQNSHLQLKYSHLQNQDDYDGEYYFNFLHLYLLLITMYTLYIIYI